MSRLPLLGPRGEGWLIGQFVLMALIGLLGFRRRGAATPSPAGKRTARLTGIALLASALMLGIRAGRDLGRNLTPLPHPRSDARLVETGVYRRIRHPMYAAVILAGIGWATAVASVRSLVVAGVLGAWLDAKARREEAWLAERFPGYAAYRARTHRFVPGVY